MFDAATNPNLGSYILDTFDPHTLAEYTKDDLEILGHTRIVIQDEPFDTNSLCTNEQVICVRSGDSDYHYMRYSNNMWLHKPGQTQVLRYLYTPTADRVWTNEAVISGQFYEYDVVYNSVIVYISYNGHNWTTYTSHQTGTHTRYCSICNKFESEKCHLTYVSSGSSGHYQSCSLCGYRSSTTAHNLEYKHSSGNNHKGHCTDCGYTTTATACTKVTKYTGSGSNHTHGQVCSQCNHSYTTVQCDLQYAYHSTVSGQNYHYQRCSTCAHVTVSPTKCLYKGSSTTCLTCGWQKGTSAGGPLSTGDSHDCSTE